MESVSSIFYSVRSNGPDFICGQKEQIALALQIYPHSNPSSRVQFVSPQELLASDNSERGTNTQNMGNICLTSGNDGTHSAFRHSGLPGFLVARNIAMLRMAQLQH